MVEEKFEFLLTETLQIGLILLIITHSIGATSLAHFILMHKKIISSNPVIDQFVNHSYFNL